MLSLILLSLAYMPDGNPYLLPTHYVASYGPYYAEIPVNDYMKNRDTSKQTYPETIYNNPYQKAWERAQEVQDAQREAFWAE